MAYDCLYFPSQCFIEPQQQEHSKISETVQVTLKLLCRLSYSQVFRYESGRSNGCLQMGESALMLLSFAFSC